MSNGSKATRESFGEALQKVGAEVPNIVVLDADLSVSTKSVLFAKSFPERFFQMGIAESNMIGTAAGLALSGFIPFVCSFGCFVTGRYETIRVSIGYNRTNVKIVGTHAGLGIGEDGYTQMGLEDINTMRAVPGMTILQPADDLTTHAAVRFAAAHVGPVYLRLTRQKVPTLYRSEQVFQSGRAILLKEGDDLALIGTGATVYEALKASEDLSEYNPWVIDIHTIKPIDRALIRTLGDKCRTLVTVEDHNVIGGLGTAVAEVLSDGHSRARLVRLGVQDNFGESGKAEELYDKYGISAKKIVEQVRKILK
ncbi:MAG: transketolase family protein [Deltaproteobacteria bacterium]|nr:transketolase family protein [Deltaproteobacteria bacterium]